MYIYTTASILGWYEKNAVSTLNNEKNEHGNKTQGSL